MGASAGGGDGDAPFRASAAAGRVARGPRARRPTKDRAKDRPRETVVIVAPDAPMRPFGVFGGVTSGDPVRARGARSWRRADPRTGEVHAAAPGAAPSGIVRRGAARCALGGHSSGAILAPKSVGWEKKGFHDTPLLAPWLRR